MVSLLLAALWVGKMAPVQLWAGRRTQGCPKSERSWPLFLNFLEQSFSGLVLIRNRLKNRLHLGSQCCEEQEQLPQALLRCCDGRRAGGGHPTSACTKCHGQAGNPRPFQSDTALGNAFLSLEANLWNQSSCWFPELLTGEETDIWFWGSCFSCVSFTATQFT